MDKTSITHQHDYRFLKKMLQVEVLCLYFTPTAGTPRPDGPLAFGYISITCSFSLQVSEMMEGCKGFPTCPLGWHGRELPPGPLHLPVRSTSGVLPSFLVPARMPRVELEVPVQPHELGVGDVCL